MSSTQGLSRNVWQRKRRQVLDREDDGSGNMVCGICKKPLKREEATIDHIKPVKNAPELLRDTANMQPAHESCNRKKGSYGFPKRHINRIRFAKSKSDKSEGK